MTTLGIDQFSINGIPSDIDAMHAAFPFGWYQLTNGLEVNVMARRAWPVYSKYYGGYSFFNPYPGNNWIYQDWNIYAEECARLFVRTMDSRYSGNTAPMIDVESTLSDSTINTMGWTRSQANQKTLAMLKIFCDTVESITGRIPVIYSGYYFLMALDAPTAPWLARLPLCLAVYPYDNYSSATEYLGAIQGIMNGTKQLPALSIPAPWTFAAYCQFTGRAPASLVPGYAKESNWAKRVDLNIKFKEVIIPPPPPTYPAYRVNANAVPNVRETPSGTGKWLGTLPANTLIYIDTQMNGYSHFQPIPSFPQSGWVYSAYITKV